MGGLAPREDGVKGRREKERDTEGNESERNTATRCRGERENQERRKSNERYKAGVKRREQAREGERRERTRLGAMCIGERIHIVRFGGKVFGQVQGDAAAGSLSLLFSLVSFSLASFLRLSSSLFLSLRFGFGRQGCSFRFVFRL